MQNLIPYKRDKKLYLHRFLAYILSSQTIKRSKAFKTKLYF